MYQLNSEEVMMVAGGGDGLVLAAAAAAALGYVSASKVIGVATGILRAGAIITAVYQNIGEIRGNGNKSSAGMGLGMGTRSAHGQGATAGGRP